MSKKDRPRCSVCGRPLRNPNSIARGVGPTCAGNSSKGRKMRAPTHAQRSSGSVHTSLGSSGAKCDLPVVDANKRLSRREMRKVRRELFEQRQPFSTGVDSQTGKPVIFVPTDDGAWKCGNRIIPHDQLYQYLLRYRLI